MKSTSALVPAICAAATAAVAFWCTRASSHRSPTAHSDPEPAPTTASSGEIPDDGPTQDHALQSVVTVPSGLSDLAGSADTVIHGPRGDLPGAADYALVQAAVDDIGARLAQLELNVTYMRYELEGAIRGIEALRGAAAASLDHIESQLAATAADLRLQGVEVVRALDARVEALEARLFRGL